MTNKNPSASSDNHRPWQIVMKLPGSQNRMIAAFYHRQDAEDHLRSLRRHAPSSSFDLVFVSPDETN